MEFEEFRAMFPDQKKVTAGNFPRFLMSAEIIVQGFMVYDVEELTEAGLKVYNAALALQINYIAMHGETEGNVTSQNVNGSSASFALTSSGADAARVSDLARIKLRSAGLCVRF